MSEVSSPALAVSRQVEIAPAPGVLPARGTAAPQALFGASVATGQASTAAPTSAAPTTGGTDIAGVIGNAFGNALAGLIPSLTDSIVDAINPGASEAEKKRQAEEAAKKKQQQLLQIAAVGALVVGLGVVAYVLYKRNK